jgi:hypothetical protein
MVSLIRSIAIYEYTCISNDAREMRGRAYRVVNLDLLPWHSVLVHRLGIVQSNGIVVVALVVVQCDGTEARGAIVSLEFVVVLFVVLRLI